MKDHRSVDDLSIEELERILLVKRREARLARVRQMDGLDHLMGRDPLEPAPPLSVPPPIPTDHRQFKEMGASANYRSVEVEAERQRSFDKRLSAWLSAPLRISWRFVFNRFFLLIEAAAVVGLIIILINARQDQHKINAEAKELEEVYISPTPTAIPQINAVVLPGGHTPPDPRGFSQPESIPQELQELANTITPQPVPTRGPEHAIQIVIPSIGVDHPVVEGDDWEALKRGVGHTPWSANPGEVGNCVLTAHNDIFGDIFRRLSEVELDDEISVHTSSEVYRYVVKATHVVEPTQVDVMDPTDHPVLTLISSYPYLVDDKRIVVIAELASP